MTLCFRVASPVWLEHPVLESVLMPGGTPASRSQAASSCSLARIVGTWCISVIMWIALNNTKTTLVVFKTLTVCADISDSHKQYP